MTRTRPIERVSHLLLPLATICLAGLFGCGAEPTAAEPEPEGFEGDSYDCSAPGADPERCEGVSMAPPVTVAPPDGASVDKAFWAVVNGSKVYIPSLYGALLGPTCKTCRCTSDQSTWPSACRVPADRTESICIDVLSCEGWSPNLVHGVMEAVDDMFTYATYDFGWATTNLWCDGSESLKVKCGEISGWGQHVFSLATCWDVPGQDVCFMGTKSTITIDLPQVAITYGTGTAGRNFIYNATLHELGHAFGLGHESGDELMKSSPPSGFSLAQWGFTGTNITAIANFNRDSVPCNWQEGDPLGLACPHEAPP